MRINSKQEVYRLLKKNRFGNRLKHWDSYEGILKEGYRGDVTMRYKSGGGGFYAYGLAVENIPEMQERWIKKGAKLDLITFNEGAPDHKLLIQGEVMRSHNSLDLHYSTKKERMRIAMKSSKHSTGLSAALLLKHHLTPSSHEDMMELLDIYPDAVIEFSTYSIALGHLPGRNTVIWEVRNY